MKRIKPGFLALMLVIIGGALAYLPLVSKLGYSFDDWYLMYAAKAYGTGAFHAVFSIDRPLRAYVMIPAYALFGENPIWYQLSAYLFRCLSGLALWWLLKMLWPRANKVALFAGLLFVIYPGFLSQPDAIDYQSHIIALCSAVFSLALTVLFFQTESFLGKSLALGGALLSGWIYLGLMEYYIGFELIRLLLLLVLLARRTMPWKQRLKQVLGWLPFGLIAGGFLYWRIFIFVSERKATDADVQLGPFLAAPVQTGMRWGVGLFHDVLDVLFSAWFVPLKQVLAGMDLGEILFGCALALLAIILVFFVDSRTEEDEDGTWWREALFLGFVGAIVGLVPVILVNREVSFPYYSRYTLISSMGAVLFWVALAFRLPYRWARQVLFSLLVGVAILTHFGNSVRSARETASMNAFWWQVSWRIPQLERGTTLVAHYPVVSALEDYFIWGPANLIYYPEKVNPDVIQPVVYAAVPNDETVERVLARERQVYYTRRTIVTYPNYRNVLLLTQPSLSSCVQIIDGSQPEVSSLESQRFVAMAPFSETEHILADEISHTPPVRVFGSEPAHDWCFYYEKASLARQQGNWEEVVRLAEEARSQGLFPRDQVEWLPLLQGWAMTGNEQEVAEINARLTDPLARKQACRMLSGMDGLALEVRKAAGAFVCPR